MSPTSPLPPASIRRTPLASVLGLGALAAAALILARAAGVPGSDAVMLACTALAAAGFFRAGVTGARPRGAFLLGWSAACTLAGAAAWIAHASYAGAGLNGLSGGLLIAGSGLLIAGVLRLPAAPPTLEAKLRLALDSLLVAASILFVAWRPVVEPALGAWHGDRLSSLAAVAIPVADVVCVTALGALLWRSAGGRLTLGLLFASTVLRTFADVRFGAYALGRVGGGDALVDTGWALSSALLAAAAVGRGGDAEPAVERQAPGRGLQVLVYLPIGAALATALAAVVVEHDMPGAQEVVLLLIAGLLMARQWLTLSENRRLLQQVAFQAGHDDLTGLLNRHGLLRCVSDIVAGGGCVRVHLLDLDRFKDVNDALGHPVGDDLLAAAGRRLLRCAAGLQVARLGGDEFAVVDRHHDAARLAERLLTAIRRPCSVAGRAIHLDASLGVAEWRADGPADDPDRIAVDLLRDADAAMYAAKAAGGGARLFEDDLRRSIVDRVALGRELRDALARGQLTLAYQPVVDLRRGVVTHVEALARWHHPHRGDVPPGVFIPIAEASGLMPRLGRWVLHTACAQAAAWSREGFDIGVCVNVSPQQLDDAGIVRDVAETLRRTRLAPGRLVLELTESLFVDDSDAVRRPLEALRAAGSRIAIDDFGTGYSALSYLRRLPVDMLKLDRGFLNQLRSADIAVLTAILDLAHTLGLEAIAEGIETAEHLAVLRRLGCDHGQGYALARPMDAAAVAAYLRTPIKHVA
jgi:diguanylate cyclase (GGDEF)-like protein